MNIKVKLGLEPRKSIEEMLQKYHILVVEKYDTPPYEDEEAEPWCHVYTSSLEIIQTVSSEWEKVKPLDEIACFYAGMGEEDVLQKLKEIFGDIKVSSFP